MKTAEIMFHQKTKTNKPLIEKRRRERMNNSLMQLKTLVLRGTNKEEHIKLEKADIMEMTVRYIEDQQQKQLFQDDENSQLAVQCFIQGYSSCVSDTSKSLDVQWLDGNFKSSLSNHLSSTLYNMTASMYHQNTNSTHTSPTPSSQLRVYNERMVTRTPYSLTPTGDSTFHQQTPNGSIHSHYNSSCSEWYSSSSTSPSSVSSDSTSPSSVSSDSTAPSSVSGNLTSPSSVNSDSDFELSPLTRSTADNRHTSPVWRPW